MMDGRANRSKMENVEGAEIASDKLIAPGMEAGDVKKLQDAGIEGLSEAKVDEILEAAEKLEKMETFKRNVEELKLRVQQLGRKAALLILDEAGTDIALALAFPPNEKLKYANILIGDSYYEYEDDEAKNIISEKEKEAADHAFVDQLEVDNQVLHELVSAQKEVDALRFRKVIEHAKTNLKQMSISEISDLISQSRSLIDASRGEIKIHVEKLKDFKEQLNKKMG